MSKAHKYWDIEESCQKTLITLSEETEKQGWKLVKQESDVLLYQKRLSPTDSLDCVKTVATLNYPADKVKDLLYHRIGVNN